MLKEKSDFIETICQAIACTDAITAEIALRQYPFIRQEKSARKYTVNDAMLVYVRDGFIDRYSGARLVNPAVLRVITRHYPNEFPFQKNWKMSETHPAYWELTPTVDHIHPVAREGQDFELNWVTTSMVRNAAKANWTIDELGWELHAPGNYSDWDGLTGWLIQYVEEHGAAEQEAYVMQWYKAAKNALFRSI